MTLREVFHRAKSRTLPNQWLYLPSNGAWTLETEGVFLDWETEEKDEDEIPLIAKRKNLQEGLDGDSIEQVVDWADQLSGGEHDAARLEVFRYYHKFDAFPERLGEPDPPPIDEIRRQVDLQFYDSLGEECGDNKCRHEGCSRGTVRLSVFCRVHHFEQVRRRPCPFQH